MSASAISLAVDGGDRPVARPRRRPAGAEVRVSPNYKLDSDPEHLPRPRPDRPRGQPARTRSTSSRSTRTTSTCAARRASAWTAARRGAPRCRCVLPAPAGLVLVSGVPSTSPSSSAPVRTSTRSARPARTNVRIPDASVIVYKSTDGGVTWQPGVVAMEGGPGTNDTAIAVAGPELHPARPRGRPGAGTGGADRVYAVGTRPRRGQQRRRLAACTLRRTTPSSADARCDPCKVAVSNDGGATYGAPVNASPSASTPPIRPPAVVNADGSVTIVWRTTGHRARSAGRALDRRRGRRGARR